MNWCRCASLLIIALALGAPAARANDYRINSEKSQATFSIRMMWIHNIDGQFEHVTGDIHLDPRGLATVDAHIAVNSVRMSSRHMYRWVLQPEFFDGAHYPTIRFLSQPVPPEVLIDGGTLEGLLTLRGITQPVHFDMLPVACQRLFSGHCVIEARGQISRTEFGMTSHHATLSDQVKLVLKIAVKPATR